MIKTLALLFVGITLGVILAWFFARYLRDLVLPLSCLILVSVVVGWFVWIKRGGLKKRSG